MTAEDQTKHPIEEIDEILKGLIRRTGAIEWTALESILTTVQSAIYEGALDELMDYLHTWRQRAIGRMRGQ